DDQARPVFQTRGTDQDRGHGGAESDAAAGPVLQASDLGRIVGSIGEALYDWDVASDELMWSANVASVFAGTDIAGIASGRLYARLLDPDNMQTRFDAVMHSIHRDDGHGVPYQVEYCLLLGPEPHHKTWIEDTGRWFAGSDGRPARAHG